MRIKLFALLLVGASSIAHAEPTPKEKLLAPPPMTWGVQYDTMSTLPTGDAKVAFV